MAPSGRKPKPTNLKVLQGNPGKRSLKKKEFRPPAEAPPCPPGLSDEARQIWAEQVFDLERFGILSRLDGTTLEAFVNNLAMMRKMQRFIDENGVTYESHTKNGFSIRKRPEMAILNECQRNHARFVSEFGLSPASRARIPHDPNQGKLFQDDWESY